MLGPRPYVHVRLPTQGRLGGREAVYGVAPLSGGYPMTNDGVVRTPRFRASGGTKSRLRRGGIYDDPCGGETGEQGRQCGIPCAGTRDGRLGSDEDFPGARGVTV